MIDWIEGIQQHQLFQINLLENNNYYYTSLNEARDDGVLGYSSISWTIYIGLIVCVYRDVVAEEGAPAMGAKGLCIPFEQPAEIKATDKCVGPDCTNKPCFYTLFGRSY